MLLENGGRGGREKLDIIDSCRHVYCTARYAGPWKEAIIKYKFNQRTSISNSLVYFTHKMLVENNAYEDIMLITCVPLGQEKFKERGYNQAELIAVRLSKLSGIPYINLLNRDSHGWIQSKLNRGDRVKNIECQFQINKDVNIKGMGILLVDDILTTGSTISMCSEQLKKAGAAHIKACVLASGRKDIL